MIDASLESIKKALAPRYHVEREIGRGGMATVYIARDSRHEREVAIKVLNTELASGHSLKRFFREIRVTASLNHPHVLPLLDSGEVGGFAFYVMPFVRGESLRDRLAAEGQLTIEDAVRLTSEIADALDAAHARGVIHRDIKPGNVLLEGGHAVVADFGIGRALAQLAADSVTGTGVILGTPAYMSPEQATGAEIVDSRTDIYSLGCVAYEMLAGEPPFTGPSAAVVIAKKLSQQPHSLTTYREGLSPEVDRVIERALSKTPLDRFESASAFARSFKAAVLQERPDRAGVRPPPSARKSRLRAGVLVLAGLATIAALASRVVLPSFSRASTQLDANKVVIFPLMDPSGTADGVLMAQLIEGVLQHAEPLRPVDGWSRLTPEQRSDVGRLTATEAMDIARREGAAFYMDGRVLRRVDSVAVLVSVHDVGGDSVFTQASRTGPGDELFEVGFDLLSSILPRWLDPGHALDFSAVEARDPAAIASWIRGEHAYRLSHFSEALGLFQRAVETDSLFAYAALKGAQAAGWAGQLPAGRALAAIAESHLDLLPPKHRQLARGYGYFVEGQADSAASAFREALALDPDWHEAWMALAEVYLHLLPSDAAGDSFPRFALERSRSGDPAFTPPLIHLAELALANEEIDSAAALIHTLEASGADTEAIGHLPLMLKCVRSGMSTHDWQAAAVADPAAALSAAKRLSERAAHLDCATQAFAAVWENETIPGEYRWGGAQGLHVLSVARGQYGPAKQVLDSAVAWLGPSAGKLYLIDEVLGAPFRDESDAYIAYLKTRFGPDLRGGSLSALWLTGSVYLTRDDTAGAALVVRALTRRGLGPQNPDTALALASLEAQLDLLNGPTSDAARRLSALQATAARDTLVWDPAQSLAVDRLRAARFFAKSGKHEDVIRVGRIFDQRAPVVYLAFLPESLAMRRSAAEAIDSTRLAKDFESRMLAFRTSASKRAP